MVKTVAESNNMCVDNGCKRSIGKKNTIFVLSNSGDSIIVKRRIVYAREKKKELSKKKKKVFTHQP